MRILVDSSLMEKKEWFTHIPINIIIDNETFLDFNDIKNKSKIINSKKKLTSFASPQYMREKLSTTEANIIFTLPSSLSGQYNAYKTAKFKNTLVIEGHCLPIFENKIIKILKSEFKLKTIEAKIKNINDKVKYDGLILNISKVPSKGRIKGFVLNSLSKFGIKVWLKFEKGSWKKYNKFKNISKVIKIIIKNKKSLNLITSNNKQKEFIISKIKKIDSEIKINNYELTNTMISHVGDSFIVISTN